MYYFFFSSRRRHTRYWRDWSSDVCSSDLGFVKLLALAPRHRLHRERIMDVLWPDLDAKSQANNLHRTLHLARKVLEGSQANAASPCLRLRGELVALCPDGQLWVDVEAFEGAAATASRSRERSEE